MRGSQGWKLPSLLPRLMLPFVPHFHLPRACSQKGKSKVGTLNNIEHIYISLYFLIHFVPKIIDASSFHDKTHCTHQIRNLNPDDEGYQHHLLNPPHLHPLHGSSSRPRSPSPNNMARLPTKSLLHLWRHPRSRPLRPPNLHPEHASQFLRRRAQMPYPMARHRGRHRVLSIQRFRSAWKLGELYRCGDYWGRTERRCDCVGIECGYGWESGESAVGEFHDGNEEWAVEW